MQSDYKNAPIEGGASNQGNNGCDYRNTTIPEKISQVTHWVCMCNSVNANFIMILNPRSLSVNDGNPKWYLQHIKGIPVISLRRNRDTEEKLDEIIARLKEIYEERRPEYEADRE